MIKLRLILRLLLSIGVAQLAITTVHAGPFKRVENSEKVPAFTLQNHSGDVFTHSDLLDKWTLVLVGFTSCPDVCPYTLGNLEHVLAETASKVRPDNLPEVVFLAVDPDRDYLSLAAYVNHFHPDFTGVTGEKKHVDAFIEGLDAFYELEERDTYGNYNVRHSADIRVIDPEGRLHATIQTPMDAPKTSDFLQRLQIEYRRSHQ
ncbi:SCO family protein [Granulosicoccus sp.]|nr:SCO family protein [Granulosicoccus sp.]MDB4224863.1 SCO family protein [Granulosicoccus sp.]